MHFLDWVTANVLAVVGVLVLILVIMIYLTTRDLPWYRRLAVFLLVALIAAFPIYMAVWVGSDPALATKPPALQAPTPSELMECSELTYYNTTVMKEGVAYIFGKDGGTFEDCHLMIREPK